MEVYIVDNVTLEILSVCRPVDYNLNLDEETNATSEIVLPALNNAKKGRYVVINGLYRQFLFVISDYVTVTKSEKKVSITMLDISNIFDRKVMDSSWTRYYGLNRVYPTAANFMRQQGIEYYIQYMIDTCFVTWDDNIKLKIYNINYNSLTYATVDLNEEDYLYNFHTFLINCRQYQNIYTKICIERIDGENYLRIDIENIELEKKLIDTTLAEVVDYVEQYDVDPVTRVDVYIPEDTENDVSEDIYTLFLKKDRTTTTDASDENLLVGRIETLTCSTKEEAEEQALTTIKANTYSHLVEFSIAKSSKLINVEDLEIGRPIQIKTEDNIYDSYISAITVTDENFVSFKSGSIRVDFTDKQRMQNIQS